MSKSKKRSSPDVKADPRTDAPGIDLTGTITSFTAENPTTVTMDAEDTAMLAVGDPLVLEPLTGDPDAIIALGTSCTVVNVAPIQLDIDLSAVNVDGLTADFIREAPTPDEGLIAAAQLLTRYPSPGVGVMPVDVAPDEVPPGMRSIDDEIPDPENPTGPALAGAARAAYIEAWRAKTRKPLEDMRKVGQALG